MIDVIEQKVKHKLGAHEMRLRHVYGVAETAQKLARLYHVSKEKAWIAGIFHDIAKYDALEDQLNMMDLRWIKAYVDYPVVYHAIAAANILEHEFKVHDQDVLNAIKHHVWGRKNMSTLEKIIFVSDYCEPNRGFEDSPMIYDMATKDLDEAVCYCMKASMDHLIRQGLVPSEEQIEIYQYYQEVTRGESK